MWPTSLAAKSHNSIFFLTKNSRCSDFNRKNSVKKKFNEFMPTKEKV